VTTFFVSRHPGAIEWANRRGLIAQRVCHLATDDIKPGDVVLGTLPLPLAATVVSRGGRYLHLEMELPAQLRGRELTADEMENYGAQLAEYFVEKR
jgi:CRISPR-associated protein Csx16